MLGLPTDEPVARLQSHRKKIAIVAALVVVVLVVSPWFRYLRIYASSGNTEGICPTWEIQRPESFYKDNSTVLDILFGEEYRNISVERWSKSVQVNTEIFDLPPAVVDDPEYWAKFAKYHKYLAKTYPLAHEQLEVHTVNTYGLVFYWKGSDKSLKPVMLTAHQDVVPVQKDTLDKWTYPPFAGASDGEYLYGRGAADTKNVLNAIMDTLELLLSQGYEPKRGIVAAFGMDEEVSGFQGARYIGQFLEEKFGKDGIHVIVDEGIGLGLDELTGTIIAMPGTGEKGYVDIGVELITPGGHSSVPPDHTSIGIMGELSYIIEKDTYEPIFTDRNPYFHYMQCLAVHAGDRMLPIFRKLILRAGFDKVANSIVIKALTLNLASKYMVQTSQAQDIIRGGEKVNALPESVQLMVNHRTAIELTVDEVFDHFVSRVVEVAKRHDLGVVANGEVKLKEAKSGNFNVTLDSHRLESAPVTPVNNDVWKAVVGVTRHIYEDFVFTNLTQPLVVAPAIMSGNTDTRHYWELTRNIYRYSPVYSENMLKDSHAHSVDEKMSIDNHLRLTAFFYEFVQVV